MSLPKIESFETLLASLTSEPSETGGPLCEFIAIPSQLVKEDERFTNLPEVKIWYRETPALSLEALEIRITKELKRLAHPGGIDIARILLAIYSRTRRTDKSAVEQFNSVFDAIVTANLNQYLVFTLPSLLDYQFQVGDFKVGRFNPERLAYQSQKAQSDYFKRYEKELRSQPLSVERKYFPVKTIDWNKLAISQHNWQPKKKVYAPLMHRLVAEYYNQLSLIYFEDFFVQLHSAQEIGMALGSGWFDPEALRRIVGVSQQLISVYLDIGAEKRGFVSPVGFGPHLINLGGAHLGLPATEKMLRKTYGFEGFKDYPVHQDLKSFCHFLALAVTHHDEGRHAEGFLHYIIALDLLLGEKNSSTQTVSKRSAVLTHRMRGVTFKEAIAESEKIYDARSRYVHEGKEPKQDLWDVAQSVCREIAFCLFRLQRDPKNQSTGFHDRWMREIDFVAAALAASRSVPDADLRAIGIGLGDDLTATQFENVLKTPKPKDGGTEST
jgi:hypothetical protein